MPDNLGGRKAVVAPVGFERALAGSTRSRRSGFCCFCISNSFHVFFMFFSRIVGSGTPRRSQQAARGRFGRPWKFPGAHSGPVRGVPRPLGTAVCGNLFLRLASWKAFAKNTVIVGSPGASAPSGRRPARLGSRRVFFFLRNSLRLEACLLASSAALCAFAGSFFLRCSIWAFLHGVRFYSRNVGSGCLGGALRKAPERTFGSLVPTLP